MRSISRKNKGFTYVELIVVLSIFSLMTSVILFDYKGFETRVDMKNLSSNIALKITETQKAALSGKIPEVQNVTATWKPAYGVFFATAAGGGADNTDFIYFTDLDNGSDYDDAACSLPPSPSGGECLEKIAITGGYRILNLTAYYSDGTTEILPNLTVTFKRPNGEAIIRTSIGFAKDLTHAEIELRPPASLGSSLSDKIKIFPSGRIEIN